MPELRKRRKDEGLKPDAWVNIIPGLKARVNKRSDRKMDNVSIRK
jgi:hypothetical protein